MAKTLIREAVVKIEEGFLSAQADQLVPQNHLGRKKRRGASREKARMEKLEEYGWKRRFDRTLDPPGEPDTGEAEAPKA